MKIGIISDTHGDISVTAQAAKIFKNENIKALFHCGDIGSKNILTELSTVGADIYAVLGNCDIYNDEWKYLPTNIGVQIADRFGEIELEGQKIAILHGDETRRFNLVTNSNNYDYVFSGHTHKPHDYKVGKTRCINAGAITRCSPPSCATLDLSSDTLILHEL